MPRRILPLALLLAATAAACSKNDAAPAAEGGAAPAAASSGATGGGSGDQDLADVASYRLTMDRLDRYYAAQRNMAVRMKAMSPAERAAMEARDEDDANQSLDDMARKIEENAVMGAAVREAGLSPREFATITVAMIQSAMAAGVLQMRPKDNQDSLVREMKASMDNVRFLRENEAVLKQKQEAFAAEMKRLGVDG